MLRRCRARVAARARARALPIDEKKKKNIRREENKTTGNPGNGEPTAGDDRLAQTTRPRFPTARPGLSLGLLSAPRPLVSSFFSSLRDNEVGVMTYGVANNFARPRRVQAAARHQSSGHQLTLGPVSAPTTQGAGRTYVSVGDGATTRLRSSMAYCV